jgi:hypothetical protein
MEQAGQLAAIYRQDLQPEQALRTAMVDLLQLPAVVEQLHIASITALLGEHTATDYHH